jgi:hypothetical protein
MGKNLQDSRLGDDTAVGIMGCVFNGTKLFGALVTDPCGWIDEFSIGSV